MRLLEHFVGFFWGSQAQAGLGQALANSLQDHYNSYHDGILFGGSQGKGQLGYLGVPKDGVIMITVVMILKAVGYSLAKASLRLGALKKTKKSNKHNQQFSAKMQ